jgi:hypothetical protein
MYGEAHTLMSILHRVEDHYYVFHCPGCKCAHGVTTQGYKQEPRWTWNESMDAPTFKPSILCNRDDPATRCHSFVTDGKIQFLGDCFHELKNKTVDLPDWDDY